MFRKLTSLIIIFGLFVLIGAIVYLSFFLKENQLDQPEAASFLNEEKIAEVQSALPEKKLRISGWIPYWKKEEGVAVLSGKIEVFDELNPFAIHILKDGSLKDDLKLEESPWKELRVEALKKDVAIVPTLLWTDATAMHEVFTNETLFNKHIQAISDFLDDQGFTGVDIDYEGKDAADKDIFSTFIRELHTRLAGDKKTLSCTVEARSDDNPPADWNGIRRMGYANDYSVLGQSCDEVRIMAYDEPFQVHRATIFEEQGTSPSAPNSDIRWVREVLIYALQTIPAEKLVLGVPTYGWEFRVVPKNDGFQYTRIGSINFTFAETLAQQLHITPTRDESGERSFVYSAPDGKHLVTLSDAEALREKVQLAKELDLRGIAIFKLDGEFDPRLFSETLKP